jgi:hypothetical protein
MVDGDEGRYLDRLSVEPSVRTRCVLTVIVIVTVDFDL